MIITNSRIALEGSAIMPSLDSDDRILWACTEYPLDSKSFFRVSSSCINSYLLCDIYIYINVKM